MQEWRFGFLRWHSKLHAGDSMIILVPDVQDLRHNILVIPNPEVLSCSKPWSTQNKLNFSLFFLNQQISAHILNLFLLILHFGQIVSDGDSSPWFLPFRFFAFIGISSLLLVSSMKICSGLVCWEHGNLIMESTAKSHSNGLQGTIKFYLL